jgi:hypothetical protein
VAVSVPISNRIHLIVVRQHAFADLRPYVCIVEDCDANHMEFASRNEFAAHLREHQHTKLWACKHCGHTNGKRHLIEAHLESTHAALNNESRDWEIMEKTLLRDLSKQKCPFCDEIPGAVKFVGHLCHHLEEISLSAVPRDAEMDDEDDGNSVQRFSMISGREPIRKGNSQDELSSSSGVGSPPFSPTSVPLSQQQAEQAKAARKPVIHLLAVQPMMEKALRDKLPNVRQDELKLGLQKVGDLNNSTGKWELRKSFYKELDVWTFDYDSSADRQRAIDNAIKQYDKMRLGVSEPVWDRLLVKSERSTGKCLSKLQPRIAQGTTVRAPKIKVQKADGSDTPNGEDDDLFGDKNLSTAKGESMGRSASQSPTTKTKKFSDKEAQAKRLLSKNHSKAVAKSAPKPAATKKHAPPPKAGTMVLSSEFGASEPEWENLLAGPERGAGRFFSKLQAQISQNDDAPYDSESDLSEVANPIVDEPSPALSTNHQAELGAQDTHASESSAAEVHGKSDGADFDMGDSPAPTAPDRGRQERSTSAESRRPAKRKLDLEDEHILAHPELYGLKRSVRHRQLCNCKNTLLTFSQARPVQRRTIVRRFALLREYIFCTVSRLT